MSTLVFAQQTISPAERIRDAAATALLALLLGIPMIGLTTVDQGGALRIATRLLDQFPGPPFTGRAEVEQAAAANQAAEAAHGIGPAAESKKEDLVFGVVVDAQPAVGTEDVAAETQADAATEYAFEQRAFGADTGVVIGELLIVGQTEVVQLDDVGRAG